MVDEAEAEAEMAVEEDQQLASSTPTTRNPDAINALAMDTYTSSVHHRNRLTEMPIVLQDWSLEKGLSRSSKFSTYPPGTEGGNR